MCCLGYYTFKLMSRHVVLSGLLWFVIPSTFFSVGHWLSITEYQRERNSTAENNITSKYHYELYLKIASFLSLLMELIAALCIPMTLGRLFNDQKYRSIRGCSVLDSCFLLILLLAAMFQLAAYSINIMKLYQFGFIKNILNILSMCTHWVNYMIVRWAALFLIAYLTIHLMEKCSNADKKSIVEDVASCLRDYGILKSNIGPLLLVFMFIDSILVMLNSFMIYGTYNAEGNISEFLPVFVLHDLNVIVSLIYICVLCNKCSNAVKSLLIPLR